MQSKFLALLAVVPLAAAQFPPCANGCSTLTTDTGLLPCATGTALDFHCACQDPSFISAVASCAAKSCAFTEVTSAYGVLSTVCANLNITFQSTAPLTVTGASATLTLPGPVTGTVQATVTSSGSGSAMMTSMAMSGAMAGSSASGASKATTSGSATGTAPAAATPAAANSVAVGGVAGLLGAVLVGALAL